MHPNPMYMNYYDPIRLFLLKAGRWNRHDQSVYEQRIFKGLR